MHLPPKRKRRGIMLKISKNYSFSPLPMTSLEELFCQIDDFCQSFEPQWQTTLLGKGLKHRQRRRCLCLSEVMTILISFHQQSYRNFLAFLWETCLSLLATSVSRTAQLSMVCRLDTNQAWCLCASISNNALGSAVASASSMPPAWRCATIDRLQDSFLN